MCYEKHESKVNTSTFIFSNMTLTLFARDYGDDVAIVCGDAIYSSHDGVIVCGDAIYFSHDAAIVCGDAIYSSHDVVIVCGDAIYSSHDVVK